MAKNEQKFEEKMKPKNETKNFTKNMPAIFLSVTAAAISLHSLGKYLQGECPALQRLLKAESGKSPFHLWSPELELCQVPVDHTSW